MARRFLSALVLAHSATALLEGFVDVLVRVDLQITRDAFAGVRNFAAGSGDDDDDEGYDACVTADAMIMSCGDAGHLDATAGLDEVSSCLCCIGTTALSDMYSNCATYMWDMPGGSTGYQIASEIYGICTDGNTCATSAALRTSSVRVATTTRAPTRGVIPAACSPMMSVYDSCAAKVDLQTAKLRDALSCFCLDESGNKNTRFEDLASSCAPAARTGMPEDYPVIARFETICNGFEPTSAPTNALVFTTAGTRTNGVFELPSATSSGSNPTGEAAGSTDSTSSSSGLAAPGAAVPGFMAWFANLATVFLSLFILI